MGQNSKIGDFEITGAMVKKIIIGSVSGLFVLLVGCGSCFFVSAGEVGVIFNSVTGKTESYQQGLHGKVPFVESVITFDVKTSSGTSGRIPL